MSAAHFEDLLNDAWDQHGSDAKGVAGRIPVLIGGVNAPAQVPPAAQLILHVLGEHLGAWDEGHHLLTRLESRLTEMGGDRAGANDGGGADVARVAAVGAIERSRLVLRLASGELKAVPEDRSPSERIRVSAQVAAVLVGRGDGARAEGFFTNAVEAADSGVLVKEDPANRALAVSGNNLACELEERDGRTPSETRLMLRAAQVARKYWEIAGGWVEVKIAEYRLAMSHLKAGDLDGALVHARLSIRICEQNSGTTAAAKPRDFFYPYEALARVERARENWAGFETAVSKMREIVESLPESERGSFTEALEQVAGAAGPK